MLEHYLPAIEEANALAELRLAESSDDERRELGQFFTDPVVAAFMARLLAEGPTLREATILDPGAGSGTLGIALASALVTAGTSHITLHAAEVDPATAVHLKAALRNSETAHGGRLSSQVHQGDFLALAEGGLGIEPLPAFDYVIANPPYFKVPPAQGPGGDAPNIYARFMEMSARLLKSGGRMCFIVPRSFASGFYFQKFRRRFQREVQLERVHVFESRRNAFKEQGVLQENIIVVYRKAHAESGPVRVSTSEGRHDLDELRAIDVARSIVFRPGDGHAVLYLPTSQSDLQVIERFDTWETRLGVLGLEISTGPVVAFRANEYQVAVPGTEPTVPFLWMNHVRHGEVVWPLGARFRKSEHILARAPRGLLVPNRNYVLTRRFSAKEEARRLTVAPLYQGQIPGDSIGFENHVNYIHRPRGEMSRQETAGLATLLGSSLFDTYFRISSGNTQVSATEIRALPIPGHDFLVELGAFVLGGSRDYPGNRFGDLLGDEAR